MKKRWQGAYLCHLIRLFVKVKFYGVLLFMPYPKRAKSPFRGSSGKMSVRLAVRRRAADIVAVLVERSPRRVDCRSTWTSSGMISVRRSMKSAHSPKSTGELLRTIHLRNRHIRLQADLVLWGMILLLS